MGKTFIYGAGTQNLRMVYQPLMAANVSVDAILDKDDKKIGTKFYGIDIKSPSILEELEKKEEKYEIIISVRTIEVVNEIRNQLSKLEYADIFSFEEFVSKKKLNCKLKKLSCVMWHLVDHCNLNCVRCSHFSPLDEKKDFYLSPEVFEKECARLSILTEGDLGEIQFSGGETLLHPQAEVFPYIAKKYFPNTQVIFITNGTMILSKKEPFFKSCRENNVQIWISHYPIGIDYNKIEARLREEKVSFATGNSGNTKEKQKKMWGIPLVESGGLDKQYNFEHCLCMQYMIRDGMMYPCPNAAYIDIFNNYFKKNYPGPVVNGVDIFKVKDLNELTEILSKPIPLCEYCDSEHRMEGIPWCVSQKDISEWSIV